MNLLEKRQEILAKHAGQSAYDPSWKGQGLELRPILFITDSQGLFLDGCVERVQKATAAFLVRVDQEREAELAAHSAAMAQYEECRKAGVPLDKPPVPKEGWQVGAARDAINAMQVGRLPGGEAVLTIRRDMLNSILWALETMDIKCCSTGV
jgi:hypothetical protein